MKTLAIIGASYLQRPLVDKARELGLRTICFSWADGAVCKDVCDVFYPISITEKEQILDICRREHIDGVCTIASDVAAPTVAYIAEQMGLRGNSYEAAVRANNKYQMRRAFKKAGVPCPLFTCVTEDVSRQPSAVSQTIAEKLKKEGFRMPLIVKPSDRSGSLGVQKVVDWFQLDAAIARAQEVSFRGEAMVEEYIEGREISVEFISYMATHYPLQITDKVTTEAPYFVELAHHQPADLTPEQYDEIYAITANALDALGIMNGASHAEYKITKDGRIAVMEIGGRMGGDFIGSDLVWLSTGYDFLRGVIDVALDQFRPPIKAREQMYAGVYFLTADTQRVKYYIDHADEYPEIVMAEQTDEELRHVQYSAQRSGYVIYQKRDGRFMID
ncbi:MAG: ATP-grasp domain-containing protein [Paludibacteraceae bacterium]|nr:ATP-grasp domain-containing protein [Paludibacteraceae bacterium]